MDDDLGDELLGLIFAACHPVLSPEARAALTLRLIGGLTTEEIARAFLPARRRSRSASSGPRRRCARPGSPSRCRAGRSGRRGSARCSRSST